MVLRVAPFASLPGNKLEMQIIGLHPRRSGNSVGGTQVSSFKESSKRLRLMLKFDEYT